MRCLAILACALKRMALYLFLIFSQNDHEDAKMCAFKTISGTALASIKEWLKNDVVVRLTP